MSMGTLEITPSPQDFLQAAEKLNTADLKHVVEGLLAIRAKRQAPVLPEAESILLEKINIGLPTKTQAYYNQLIEKRLDETITKTELKEFLSINRQLEQMNVERITNLVKLAKLRQVTLPQLMDDLGISSPGYVS